MDCRYYNEDFASKTTRIVDKLDNLSDLMDVISYALSDIKNKSVAYSAANVMIAFACPTVNQIRSEILKL